MKKLTLLTLLFICLFTCVFAQTQAPEGYTLLKPDRVFDGQQMHAGWWVLVKGNRITAVGEPSSIKAPEGANIIDLKGSTLMPGMIEGHSHLFLHPYNETLWDDQVLKESRAERTIR
ncbi:MAG: amidohydrolase family protein, partial [Mucilaginibacter sp.]